MKRPNEPVVTGNDHSCHAGCFAPAARAAVMSDPRRLADMKKDMDTEKPSPLTLFAAGFMCGCAVSFFAVWALDSISAGVGCIGLFGTVFGFTAAFTRPKYFERLLSYALGISTL